MLRATCIDRFGCWCMCSNCLILVNFARQREAHLIHTVLENICVQICAQTFQLVHISTLKFFHVRNWGGSKWSNCLSFYLDSRLCVLLICGYQKFIWVLKINSNLEKEVHFLRAHKGLEAWGWPFPNLHNCQIKKRFDRIHESVHERRVNNDVNLNYSFSFNVHFYDEFHAYYHFWNKKKLWQCNRCSNLSPTFFWGKTIQPNCLDSI